MTTDLQTSPTLDLMRVDRQIQRRVLRQRIVPLVGFTAVVALGLRKGGALGWLGAGVGLWALARALWTWRSEQPEWRRVAARQAPSPRRLLRSRDPVDQSSANSFPASDAPSRHEN